MALMPVDDALKAVLANVAPLGDETVPLADAHGRVLAHDLAARCTVPMQDVSAMDGYAVRGTDIATLPATLRVIGEVAAGHPADARVASGEAMRIFTGGVVPAGADSVVIQENTTRNGDVIVINEGHPHRNIRKAGNDFREGDVLVHKGTLLSGRHLSLIAAMNHAQVALIRAPRVTLLSTGDELVPPGGTLMPGQVIHSNTYALKALGQSAGAQVSDLGIVRDTLDDTRAAIRRAAQNADILVTTGGASVGDHDYIGRALSSEGFDMAFWKVAMRPGKPVMFGTRGALRVIGLPGNPVSSYVCALLFMVPLIRAMLGRSDVAHTTIDARASVDLPANDARQDYMRATLSRDSTGALVASPVRSQDSSLLAQLAQADALMVRPPHAPALKAGDTVPVLRLPRAGV